VSYLRSVYLQKDKSIFKLEELPVERFAESLGLPGVPKIKFLSKEIAKRKKNASHVADTQAEMEGLASSQSEDETGPSSGEDDEDEESADDARPTKANEEQKPTKVYIHDLMFKAMSANYCD
jgi:ATP-dependent RNA helicase DDX10/DBP4